MATLKSAIAKFLGLTQKLEAIDKKFQSVDETICHYTASQSQLDELGVKVDDLDSTVSDADSKVDDLESTVSDLESRIDDCESEINDIDDKVSNAVDELKDELSDELSEQVTEAIAESRQEITKGEIKTFLRELLAEDKTLKLIVRDTLIEILNSK